MKKAQRHLATRELGAQAEEIAAHYLESQGYRVVTRNFRCQQGEVDLIAWDGPVLCFVEVRSRANDAYGDPLQTIGPKKIQKLIRAARRFLTEMDGPWPEMRFDAVGILMSEPPCVNLIRGAFEA